MKTRSWTELSSNVTQLEGIRLDEHLDDLIRQGGAPAELLQSCLHEFTHHACFLSSVGVAITGLVNRAARTSLLAADELSWPVARDLLAYRTATAALRPLAEGLALFAEFDVMSFEAKVMSTPLVSATMLFSGRFTEVYQFDESDRMVTVPTASDDMLSLSLPISVLLQQVRLTDAGIRRKTNVLAASTEASEDPYLLGYLAVKGMWRAIRQASKRLYRETDLALLYLLSFFYEDRRLLEILLGPRSNENESTLATAILQRLLDRTKDLSDVTDDDIAEFEELQVGDVPAASARYASCLHVDLDEWNRGQHLLDNLKAQITSPPDDLPKDATRNEILSRNIDEVFAIMFSRRHIVHLGSSRAWVEVEKNGNYTVTLADRVILRATGASRSKEQSGWGLVELLFSVMSIGARRAIAIYGPESFVDVTIPGDQELPPEELDLIRANVRPSPLFVNLAQGALRLAETYLEDRGTDHLLTRVEPEVHAAIKSIYIDIATNAVADEDLDRVVATLDAGGIYAILGNDRDLLDALIIVGAMSPTIPYRILLAGELRKHGFADPDSIMDALVASEHTSGLPLAGTDGLQLLVQV